MKDFSDGIIDFIKGLMQPAITVFAIGIGLYLVLGGKIPAGDAWWVVLGVIGFWFGKTVGLFGDSKGQAADASVEKADLIQTVAAQSQDLATSTPAPVVNKILEKMAPSVTTTGPAGVNKGVPADPDPDAYLKEIS